MITYECRIIGYHCNYKSKVNDFITKNCIVISNDTYFLGTGMYFWISLADLEYWENKKSKDKIKESIHEEIISLSASISYNTNQIMDLTTPTDFEMLMKIKKLLISKHKKYKKLDDIPIGALIDSLMFSDNSIVKAFLNNYKIFKMNVRYDGYNNKKSIVYDVDFYNKKLPRTLSIDFGNKTIYCVKDSENIRFLEVLEREVVS